MVRRLSVVALLASLLAAAVATGSIRREGFAPTPTGPVYGGVPGALPLGFRYLYNSSYVGWPIRPLHAQHPVRGSFLDPRGVDDTGTSGYHFGIDVSVDDRHPDPGAPPGLSHRVYAVESGVVKDATNPALRSCLSRRLDVGHFSYWHVSPTVHDGQQVRAREPIGWSCRNVWHVHLSEWQRYQGSRIWVNPLHAGGRLAPYADTTSPVINGFAFVTPPTRPWQPTTSLAAPDTSRPLRPNDLHGLVELRANIDDPQSFHGFLHDNPAWPTAFTPYRVAVRVQSTKTGSLVMQRISFQADQMPQTPYIVHYAPGTVEDDNMMECVGPPALPRCAGTYWFRPFSRFRQEFWNTRTVTNGTYTITVTASDLKGNRTARSETVTVNNPRV
jgi:hypothetical protein